MSASALRTPTCGPRGCRQWRPARLLGEAEAIRGEAPIDWPSRRAKSNERPESPTLLVPVVNRSLLPDDRNEKPPEGRSRRRFLPITAAALQRRSCLHGLDIIALAKH